MTETKYYNHLIQLTPLDYYFFGGEQTFGNGKNVNYFAKTRAIPQQTSVLGLLRHLGYYIDGVEIGNSFDATLFVDESDSPYGYIKQLSPLFFVREETLKQKEYYIPSCLGQSNAVPFDLTSAGQHIKYWNGEDWMASYQLPDYKSKNGWEQALKGINGHFPISKVVKFFEKTGIIKTRRSEDSTDAFFKQKLAKLEKNWKFGILAQLDEEQARLLPKSQILPFGAEKALFHIELIALKKDTKLTDYFPSQLWKHNFPAKELDCVFLLSDALVSDDIYQACKFTITDIVDFRNIRSPKKIKEFARLRSTPPSNAQTADSLYKSGKYNFLKRGSLLYGKASEIKGIINKYPAYQTIGYNHYTTLSF